MKRKALGWWKTRFTIEPGEGGAGGSGGGGSDSGAEGGAAGAEGKGSEGGSKDGEGESGGDKGGEADGGDSGKPAAISPEIQQELDRLRGFHAKASAHVEIDPTTGDIKPKKSEDVPRWTAEQIAQAQLENTVAEKSAALIELNRAAETKTIEKFKAKDVMFADNFLKAREKMMGLPASQRTEQIWERAYNMAAGEAMTAGKYEKVYREQGKADALKELEASGSITMPQGSGEGKGGSGSGKADLSKVTLSREERDAASKLIAGGLVGSLDEYKENILLLDSTRGG